MIKYVLVVALLCAAIVNADENGKPRLGMWAWKQSDFDTVQSRTDMLDFCEKEGISHIDQHVSIGKGAIENADALTQLMVEASQRKVTVNVLRGDPQMFFEANHQRTMSDIKAIVTFDRSLPDDAKLLGIKFDVEPYLTPEWKAEGEQRERVLLDYLSFLVKAKAYLEEHAPQLELAVDIPFWWDKSSLEVMFEGNRKLFVHHIQDHVSWIGIMSYRRDPDLTVKLVKGEVDYAAKNGLLRSVAPGMETSTITGEEAHISFGGVPPEQFRTALASLRETFSGNPHIRCIMLHHYGSLRTYLSVMPGK
jgi:hypothetical protein